MSDDGSDVDFDEVDEDLEDDIQEGQEDDEDKRRRRKPAHGLKRKIAARKAPAAAKKLKDGSPLPGPLPLVSYPVSEDEDADPADDDADDDLDDQTPSTSSGDREDSRDAIFEVGSEGSAKRKFKTAAPSGGCGWFAWPVAGWLSDAVD